jgi:hypothetical protein
MGDWQDIETAPKDGTPILAWNPDRAGKPDEIYVVVWYEFSYPERDGIGGHTGKMVKKQGWLEAGGEEYEIYRPTKWMPRPLPPA